MGCRRRKLQVEMKLMEAGADWQQITMRDAIRNLEGKGYWKKDTTRLLLESGEILWTPFHQFRAFFIS